VHDPVVALAHVAGHTDRIGLGTATVCAPFTAPALLAKTLTSLDVVSGGRLTVGLGIGWLPQEYIAAGVPFERRGARMDEYLRCLEALWTQDPVEFVGEFYAVPRSHVGPPPVQRPHPPVLLGGAAAPALRRAGRLTQGWIASSRQDLTRIGACVETVRGGAREAGRDPEAVRIVVRGLVDLLDDPGGRRRRLQGTREQVLDDLAALRAQGVTEVFFDLNLCRRFRIVVLRTFLTVERGRSGQTYTCLGAFTLPIRSLANATSSASDSSASACGWTTATTRSPHFSSGSPTTPQSRTAGCAISACSTSAEYTLNPPAMIMSLARSTMKR
jgi:probable F420-dependent oxidoreductase